MSIYDDFLQFGDDQDLFGKCGCNVCGGWAPTDCQGSVEDDVQHEPYCPLPKFMAVMWEASKRDEAAEWNRRAGERLFRTEANKAINRILTESGE